MENGWLTIHVCTSNMCIYVYIHIYIYIYICDNLIEYKLAIFIALYDSICLRATRIPLDLFFCCHIQDPLSMDLSVCQWFNGKSRGNPGLYHHFIYTYIHIHNITEIIYRGLQIQFSQHPIFWVWVALADSSLPVKSASCTTWGRIMGFQWVFPKCDRV